MMQFSEDYFDDEVRDGFYIPSIMKRCWAAQIEVLKVIEDICNRHGLKYFAISGTLMGAIRHGGYIPWDDDIDIGMLRSDFDDFLRYAQKEMPEHYFCRNSSTDDEYREGFTRFTNDKYIRFKDEEFLKKGHGFMCTAGVDVFPLDYIPDSEEKSEEIIKYANIFNSLVVHLDENGLIPEINNLIKTLESQKKLKVNRNEAIAPQLMKAVEELFTSLRSKDSSNVNILYDWLKGVERGNRNRCFPKKFFKEAVNIPFENTTISVPKDYHEFMSQQFGDYMKPIRVCETHNFPWFKDEYEMAKSHYGISDYHFNREELPQANRREKYIIEQENSLTEYMNIFQKASQMAEDAFSRGDNTTGQMLLEKCQTLVGNAEDIDKRLKGNGKRRVVFLTWKSRYWDKFAPFYERELSDSNTEVFVIAVPFFRSNEQLQKGEATIDTDGFPEGIKLTNFDEFDFEEYRIDRIYTQYAYDQYNEAVNYYPAFFTDKLTHITDELIYVPWFELDEYGTDDERAVDVMRFFLFIPGIVKCDKIILSSGWLKEHYVRELTKWAGEDTKSVWEDKIVIDNGSLEIIDNTVSVQVAAKEKKVLFYYIGTGQLLFGGEKMIEKMRNNMLIFEGAKENIEVILYIEKNLKEYLKEYCSDCYDNFVSICEDYAKKDWCKYVEAKDTIDVSNTVEIERLIDSADAFYGDAGLLMHYFSRAKKPVMMQNLEV